MLPKAWWKLNPNSFSSYAVNLLYWGREKMKCYIMVHHTCKYEAVTQLFSDVALTKLAPLLSRKEERTPHRQVCLFGNVSSLDSSIK